MLNKTANFMPMFYENEAHPLEFLIYRILYGLPDGVALLPGGTPASMVDCGHFEKVMNDFDLDRHEAQLNYIYFAPNKTSWKVANRLARMIKRNNETSQTVAVGAVLSERHDFKEVTS